MKNAEEIGMCSRIPMERSPSTRRVPLESLHCIDLESAGSITASWNEDEFMGRLFEDYGWN